MKNTTLSTMLMFAEMEYENEKRVQESIDKYWEARKFPRKKKKQMRKEANEDYKFWNSLKNLHNQF